MSEERTDFVPTEGADVATLIVHCNVKTGEIRVAGHMDSLYLNLQMLAEAGHVLIERNAKLLKAASTNGNTH